MGSIDFNSLGKVMQRELLKDQHKIRTKIGSIKFLSELSEASGTLSQLLSDSVHGQIYMIIQEMKKHVAIKDLFIGLGTAGSLDLSGVRIEPQDLIENYENRLKAFRAEITKNFKLGECWLKGGKKASTVLREILQVSFNTINKKNIHRIATVMNSKAKECYTPEGNYIGYFGQGKFIGSGRWEPEGTCTRIKEADKPYLYPAGWADVQTRIFPLVTRSAKTPTTQKGRVIVAFAGNGCLRFWNNYYVGQKITMPNFIKIFEEIYEVNLEKITTSPKLPSSIKNSNFINYAKDLVYQNPSQGWWRIKGRPTRATYIVPTKVRCTICRKYTEQLGGSGMDRHRYVCPDCSSKECPICKVFPSVNLVKLGEAERKLSSHEYLCKTCYDKTIGKCVFCGISSIEKYWFLNMDESVKTIFCCKKCSALVVEGQHESDDTLAFECTCCGVFISLKNIELYNKETNLCTICTKEGLEEE